MAKANKEISFLFMVCTLLKVFSNVDKKKGSLTTSTFLLTLNLNLYEKNVLQR